MGSRWLRFGVALLPLILVTGFMAIVRPDLAALASYGYLGVFAIMAAGNATVLLPMPGLATVVAAGALWNPLLVGLAGGLGGSIGELTGYVAGRGANELLDGAQARWFKRFQSFVQQHGFPALILLSAIPNPLFDVVGIAAGSLGYQSWRFFVAVAIGNTIKCMAVAAVGGALGGWLARG
ncbi:MAG: VTT domain-containing protein [Chloroflexota bacterium]